MKLSRRSELGRSLIEMIAVLVVIAILTIGSLGGYSFLVRKWRENQAIDQVNSLIVGMRAGNLSQRFAAGESIPVQTIVRGLKTDADGAAILPDGDNSWAKVTSFGVNNYMIALEVQPGTCEELLNNMTTVANYAPDIIGFCNHGDFDPLTGECSSEGSDSNLINKLKELSDDEKEREIIDICSKTPTLSLIWGCGQGTANYFYAGKCHECNKNERLVKNGCCKEENIHRTKDGEEYCECPNGSRYDAQLGYCVECITNEHCAETYSGQFEKKVCFNSAHECVECLDDDDCSEDKANTYGIVNWKKLRCNTSSHKCAECDNSHPTCPVYKIGDAEWRGVCLFETYTCIECIRNYDGSSDNGVCPEEAPECDDPGTERAKCRECPTGLTWNVTKSKCVCENGHFPACIKWEDDDETKSCIEYKCDDPSSSCISFDDPKEPNNGCMPAGEPTDTCINGSSKTSGGAQLEADSNLYGCHECAFDKLDDTNPDARRPEYCQSVDFPFCSNRLSHVWTETENGTATTVVGTSDPTYTCHRCLDTTATPGRMDLGCDKEQPVCDEATEQCGCKSVQDCLENWVCDTDRTKKEFGSCIECPHGTYQENGETKTWKAVRPVGQQYCECESGFTKICPNVVSDIRGNLCGFGSDASWTCAKGCLQNTDCDEDNECSLEGRNYQGTTPMGQRLGTCVPCPTINGVQTHRSKNGLACEPCPSCSVWDSEKKECVSTCNGVNDVCVSSGCGTCTSTVESGRCVVTTSGNGNCVQKPTLYVIPGLYNHLNFYAPPPQRTWCMTWTDAERFCASYGKKLATVDEACMKSLSADSGHDCPNITGVRGAGNVVANRGTIYDVNGENGHSLSAWNVSSYGSFWINGRLPGTCKSLRVTYSCGNNHPTDVCDCYYPLCVDPGATGSYDNFDWDDFVYTLTDEEKAEQERVLRGECPCGDEEVAGTYHTDEHPVFVLRCRALPQGCECGYSENSNGTCSCNEPPECPNGSYIKNNDGTCSCDESSNGTCRDTDGSDLNMSGWVAIKRDANGQCQCKPTPIKVNWKEDVSAVNGEIEKTLDFGGKSYCGKLGFYGSAKGKLNNVGHGCTDNKYKYEFNADVSTDVKGKSEFSYKMKRVCSEATDVGLNGLFILR